MNLQDLIDRINDSIKPEIIKELDNHTTPKYAYTEVRVGKRLFEVIVTPKKRTVYCYDNNMDYDNILSYLEANIITFADVEKERDEFIKKEETEQ